MFSGFGRDCERHPLDDLEAEALEAAVLGGVVGHEPHRGDAEVDEDLRADAVLAAVDGQAELDVGVDGVAALVLQRCTPRILWPRPMPAALVAAQVHDDAVALARRCCSIAASSCDAAVAAQRAEHVAGEALAVHPDEHVVARPAPSPRTNGDVLLAVEQRLVRRSR